MKAMVDHNEPDLHEASCPRCGGDAQWFFLDAEKSRIEVICADCGRFELTRPEFDQIETEIVERNERERTR